MAKNKKKKKSNDKVRRNRDISIVQDIKEPFSWSRFWDEKVLANWIAFKGYLDRKGILYLLMSPFRYRARRIVVLWLIVLCTLVGLVPRSVQLVNDAKKQYRSNEFVIVKDKIFQSGRFTVTPLMSSHKNNVHVMTFNLIGDSSAGVPSTTDGFDVRMTPRNGISKPEEITYRYQVVPFDSSQRILVVELDLSHTENTGGVYDLWVNQKGKQDMQDPLQITVSKQQESSPLYDGKVHLSALSSKLSTNSSDNLVSTAQTKLDDQLKTYKIEYDRLNALGTEMVITPDQMKEFVKDNAVYGDITDKSTTDKVDEAPIKQLPELVAPQTGVIINGKTYSEADYRNSSGTGVEGLDPRYADDLITSIENVGKVVSALSALNQARLSKYTDLYGLSRTLSATFRTSQYTKPQTIANTKTPLPDNR
jgi:hypothetical protein